MLRALAVVTLVLAAPAGAETGRPAPLGTGLEGAWRVVGVGGEALLPDDDVFVTLVEGQLSGKNGCNRIMGPFASEGATLRLGPLAGTRMACPGRAAEVEARVDAALATVTGWRRDGEALELLAETGVVLRAHVNDRP